MRRQWVILSILKARVLGVTVRALAAELEVSQKTIRRDLDLFRSVGFPLEETVGAYNRKAWRLRPTANQPPLSFTFEEAAALYLGRRSLEPLAGSALWQAAHQALRKVKAVLGTTALDYIDRFQDLFHFTTFGTSDYTSKGALLDKIMLGIEDRKAIHILYQSDRATEPAFRDVYPYDLTRHSGSLYLIAHDPQEDKTKTYKLDRIEDVENSNFPFQRPKDFHTEAFLSSALGIYQGDRDRDITVKIQFAPAVARFVMEKRWHHSQKLTRQRDGSLIAEFRLSCTQEIKSWVLGFGRQAVVLQPESLQREIVDELDSMNIAYGRIRALMTAPDDDGYTSL
jgi:predicted DNA-binding transcriptional regulator YafY